MRPDTTFQPTADAGPRCDIRATDANRPRRLDAAAVSSFATPAISCLCALGMVVTCRGSSMMRATSARSEVGHPLRRSHQIASCAPINNTLLRAGRAPRSTNNSRSALRHQPDASRTSSNEAAGRGSRNPRRAAARFASASAAPGRHGYHTAHRQSRHGNTDTRGRCRAQYLPRESAAYPEAYPHTSPEVFSRSALRFNFRNSRRCSSEGATP